MKNYIVLGLCVITGLAATAVRAQEIQQWNGRWFYDAAASTIPSHTYTLSRLANGALRHDDGDFSYDFFPDGKPYQEPSSLTISVVRFDDTTFDYSEASSSDRRTQHHQQLSQDGKRIVDRVMTVNAGREDKEVEKDIVRVGPGSGFLGTWKIAPEAYVPTAGPTWVIWNSRDGTMTWNIPRTGEIIRGKVDGRSRPITGPHIPAGVTFVWKQSSPTSLDFYASENGRLIERAIETLSPDGRTFTDTLWPVSREGEKRISVFRKE